MDYQERINKVIDQIKGEPDRIFSVEDMASLACFSPFHFHRVFTNVTGETPADFLRRERITLSVERLLHQKRFSITDIAMESGFSSPSNFSKAFKKVTGLSPRQCRKMGYDEVIRRMGKREPQPLFSSSNEWRALTQNARIEEVKSFTVAYLRYRGEYDIRLGLHWKRCIILAKRQGLLTGKEQYYGIGYDNPDLTTPGTSLYDSCISIESPGSSMSPLAELTISGGRYAVFPYRGPGEGLPRLYGAIYGFWCEAMNEEVRDDLVLQRIPEPPRGAELTLELMIPLCKGSL